jgi:predicted anti-sigma-YlaC factor YlaD
MTCQELSEIVTDYLEGAMSLQDRIRFDLHLAVCPECRRYVEQMRQTVEAVGRVPPEPIPPEVEAKLLERFRDWKRAGPNEK